MGNFFSDTHKMNLTPQQQIEYQKFLRQKYQIKQQPIQRQYQQKQKQQQSQKQYQYRQQQSKQNISIIIHINFKNHYLKIIKKFKTNIIILQIILIIYNNLV